MGSPTEHPPVLLLLAAFSRYPSVLVWAGERASASFGRIECETTMFDFDQTAYYEPSMGSGLKKKFLAFERLIQPGELPRIKRTTNEWEQELAAAGEYPEARPLNLDPGYLTLSKLVLASTKDHAHRIYLADGVYGEITLAYQRDTGWRPNPWTFPDYHRPEYHAFFAECREYLRRASG